jgi:hypothetical protein
MRLVFHIVSTGGGGGASRVTRYISEREKDLEREGRGARPLFSEDREGLTYRKADRILDPFTGEPDKNDLLHVTVSVEESEFDKLGDSENEKQERFREVIREGMKGMAQELNVESLTWVAGIHRNSDNPHAHIVMRNSATDRGSVKEKEIGRLRKSLLPHKEMQDGREVIVPGRIGEKFVTALDKQQQIYLNRESEQIKARQAVEQLINRFDSSVRRPERAATEVRSTTERGRHKTETSVEYRATMKSWGGAASVTTDNDHDYRIALGEHLEFSLRLAFAEVWRERAVQHGDTYRFNVVDQTTGEERKISDLDVHRRASARAQRISLLNRDDREQAYEADLSKHRETLDQLSEARESKIAALGKDIGSLRGTVSKLESNLSSLYETPGKQQIVPLISRSNLSELQNQAVRLNLTERVSELEKLRIELAREHKAPARTDDEAATLVAQVNVARADLLARSARLDNFEASEHLSPYEVHGERWSLAAIDKQISRRQQDAKFVPERAARLDLRSLAHLNYSTEARQQAAAEIEHLVFVRGEIVREIERQRKPLVEDRELSAQMLDVLEKAYRSEERTRVREGKEIPEPRYEVHQMRALESSAELLRDHQLLHEVHEWERSAFASSIDWQGRALAREVMSGIAVEETRGRLQHFLENQRVASLNLGHHRTGTLREVEARTLIDYLARGIESSGARDYRRLIKATAHEQHSRLVTDFDKATKYHEAAREMAIQTEGREPQFTDKEKINLEIYAERNHDESIRQQLFGLARGSDSADERGHLISQIR